METGPAKARQRLEAVDMLTAGCSLLEAEMQAQTERQSGRQTERETRRQVETEMERE
jgi:hypothetical protein